MKYAKHITILLITLILNSHLLAMKTEISLHTSKKNSLNKSNKLTRNSSKLTPQQLFEFVWGALGSSGLVPSSYNLDQLFTVADVAQAKILKVKGLQDVICTKEKIKEFWVEEFDKRDAQMEENQDKQNFQIALFNSQTGHSVKKKKAQVLCTEFFAKIEARLNEINTRLATNPDDKAALEDEKLAIETQRAEINGKTSQDFCNQFSVSHELRQKLQTFKYNLAAAWKVASNVYECSILIQEGTSKLVSKLTDWASDKVREIIADIFGLGFVYIFRVSYAAAQLLDKLHRAYRSEKEDDYMSLYGQALGLGIKLILTILKIARKKLKMKKF